MTDFGDNFGAIVRDEFNQRTIRQMLEQGIIQSPEEVTFVEFEPTCYCFKPLCVCPNNNTPHCPDCQKPGKELA